MSLVVGDIGGQFDAVKKLVEGFSQIILVGDLMDRGPKSKEVVEWAMTDNRVTALKGNHEDMMLDFYDGIKFYHPGDWLRNGGFQTLVSYGLPTAEMNGLEIDIRWAVKQAREIIPKSHIEFLKSLKMSIETDEYLISHAPKPPGMRSDFDWFWNRQHPIPTDKTQIFGHNSGWGLTVNEDEGWICLDDSRAERLTGYCLKTKAIHQVSFAKEEAQRPAEA